MEFLVVEEEGAGLRHVLNFPNPFSTNTVFQFEHPLQNQDIDIRIDIFSLSGRLVKTLFETVKASGNLSRDVRWDGRDEYGDPMANGIYIYRVKVTAQGPGGALAITESDLQKLVILR
jgi:flagellar hook assembly protein FlgD